MPHTSSQRGFSLVEVLMVLCIVSIGLLGLLSLQVMTLRSGTTSRGRETATYIARGLLDEVQAEAQVEQLQSTYGIAPPKGFVTRYGGTGSAEGVVPFDHQGRRTTSPTDTLFRATWKRLEPRGGTPGAAEFRVEVIWAFETGPGGAPIQRMVSMDRLIAR